MSNGEAGVLHPIAVLKESVAGWLKNLIFLALLYSVNVILSLMLRFTNEMAAGNPSIIKPWIIYSIVLLEAVFMAVLSSFICFLCINFLKKYLEEKRTTFISAYQQTCAGFAGYIKAMIVLLIFVLAVLGVATLFSEWGKQYYWAKGANNFKMAVLLGASTVSVALSIAAAWYGFFFAFAPLIAAFEKKGVFAAMRESRARVRGNALRALSPFLLLLIFYIAFGVLTIFIATRFTHDRQLLDFIDPVMVALFAPLALAIWYVSYRKLADLKKVKDLQ